MKRFSAIALTAVLAATLSACGGNDEQTDNGETADGLTIYSGRVPDLIEPALDMYEQETGQELQVRFGETPELAATLVEEGEGSRADVFFSQDAGALAAVDEAGLLAELPDDVLDEVPPRFRADSGRWVGVSARARVIAYDTRELSPDELPESVTELTDDKWEGRVGWAPTNASLHAYVSALRASEGEDAAREWLEEMVANDAQAYESNTPIRDAIAAGEIDAGLVNHYYVAQAIEEQGEDYPVDVYFPPGDLGSMINVAGVGVLESSERKQEAFDFVRFMLDRQAQRYFAESSQEYPLLDGVPQPEAVPPLEEVPAPDFDLADLADLEQTLELMRETGAL